MAEKKREMKVKITGQRVNPTRIDLQAGKFKMTIDEPEGGVVDLHDPHIWPLSTTQTALTVHLVRCDGYMLDEGHPGDQE